MEQNGEITDEVQANLLSADHLFAKQSDFKDNLPAVGRRRQKSLAAPGANYLCFFFFHLAGQCVPFWRTVCAKWPGPLSARRSCCFGLSSEITAVLRYLTGLEINLRRGSLTAYTVQKEASRAAGRTYATVLICFQEEWRPSWSELWMESRTKHLLL